MADIRHPPWCDLTACTAASGNDQTRAYHVSATRRIEVPGVGDTPVLELWMELPAWEPVTAEPTCWLRITRTDVAESVERYALEREQLRALAAAATDMLRLIDAAAKPAPAGPACPDCGAADHWQAGTTEQVCPTCGHTASGPDLESEFSRWLDDGEVSS